MGIENSEWNLKMRIKNENWNRELGMKIGNECGMGTNVEWES